LKIRIISASILIKLITLPACVRKEARIEGEGDLPGFNGRALHWLAEILQVALAHEDQAGDDYDSQCQDFRTDEHVLHFSHQFDIPAVDGREQTCAFSESIFVIIYFSYYTHTHT